MATLDELLVRIDASTELLRRELKKGEGDVANFERRTTGFLGNVDKRFSLLGKGIKTALGFLGVGLSIRGLQQTIVSAVRFGDAIDDASRAANVSAETLQELRFAFSQLGGVADQQTDGALQRFTKTLGDAADGGTESIQAFRRLGIEIRDSGGQIRENEEVLDEALRSLASIESGSVRAARAADLFGREAGPEMAAALSKGIDAMNELREATPGVLSNENVRLAAELNDEFERMGRVVGGTVKNAVIGLTADLADLFGILSERTDALLLVAELEHTVAALERSEARGRREPALEGRRRQLEEARRQLLILDAEAAGRQGFPTRSFLNEAPVQIGPGVPFAEQRSIVAELEVLERERAAANQLITTELGKQKDLAIRLSGAQQATADAERERLFAIQTKRKEDDTVAALAFAEEYQQFLDRVRAANLRVTEGMGHDWQALSQTMHFALTDTLADAFLGIETDFGDMLRRMAAQLAASAFVKFVGGSIGGPFGAFIAGGVPGLASGGSAMANRTHIVGEKGPEVFRPNLAGTVYPSVGSGPVVINQSIHFDSVLESVDARIYRAAPMIARATEAKLNESRSRGR